jgi:hypothetical protein
MDNAFAESSSLYSINSEAGIILPEMPKVQTMYNTFASSIKIQFIKFPESLPELTTLERAIYNNTGISSVIFPKYTPKLTNISYLCYNCNNLAHVSLPEDLSLITTSTNMFYRCYILNRLNISSMPLANSLVNFMTDCYSINNINCASIGSTITPIDGTNAFDNTELLESLTLNANFSKFSAHGSSGKLIGLKTLRLLNNNSTFSGTAPQINITYTSLDASAIDQVFLDLPTLSK